MVVKQWSCLFIPEVGFPVFDLNNSKLGGWPMVVGKSGRVV
jgi:hypothetical protein